MVRDTSIEAYQSIKACGKEGTQKRAIYEWVAGRNRAVSRSEISARMGIPINAVAGRVNSLVKEGALKEPYQDKCKYSGRMVWMLLA